MKNDILYLFGVIFLTLNFIWLGMGYREPNMWDALLGFISTILILSLVYEQKK